MVGACLIAGRAALQQGAGSVTLGTWMIASWLINSEPRLMLPPRKRYWTRTCRYWPLAPGWGKPRVRTRCWKPHLPRPARWCWMPTCSTRWRSEPAKKPPTASIPSHPAHAPHPVEAARLLNMSPAEIQANRIGAARTLSQQYQ